MKGLISSLASVDLGGSGAGIGVLILFSLAVASTAFAGDITYDFVPLYDAGGRQAGGVSGSVLTSGNTRTLAGNDVLSWEWDGSSWADWTGYDPFSSTSGGTLSFSGLTASNTQLVLAPGGSINWSNGNEYFQYLYGSPFNFVIGVTNPHDVAGNNFVAASSPMVIAQAAPTPEPSTFALLATGAIAIGGCGFWRRRRLRHSQATTAYSEDNTPTLLSFPSQSAQRSTKVRRAA